MKTLNFSYLIKTELLFIESSLKYRIRCKERPKLYGETYLFSIIVSLHFEIEEEVRMFKKIVLIIPCISIFFFKNSMEGN